MRLVFAAICGVVVFACHGREFHLLSFAVSREKQAVAASSMGGTTEARRRVETRETASLICGAVALGNSDHNNAIAPVTNGTATLVPPSVSVCPSGPRLVMVSPGAVKPRLPIEIPRFESGIGLPRRSQATTGMTHGWRVMVELPRVP